MYAATGHKCAIAYKRPCSLQEGLGSDVEIVHVGTLTVEVDPMEQEVRLQDGHCCYLSQTSQSTLRSNACCTTLENAVTLAVNSGSCKWLQTVALELLSAYQCHPVFLGKELKEEYYKGVPTHCAPHVNEHSHKCCGSCGLTVLRLLPEPADSSGAWFDALMCCAAGFCKQQLWPLFHYLIPLSPTSSGRFDPVLWQAYVKANKVCCCPSSIAVHPEGCWPRLLVALCARHGPAHASLCFLSQAFSDKLVEIVSMDDDYVWIHDYHLMVGSICM